MLTDPPPDTKPFTLLRLLTVIAVVAALSAFAPKQVAPTEPPTSSPQLSQQPRHHFIPPLRVKP